jgi:hypothetical protein
VRVLDDAGVATWAAGIGVRRVGPAGNRMGTLADESARASPHAAGVSGPSGDPGLGESWRAYEDAAGHHDLDHFALQRRPALPRWMLGWFVARVARESPQLLVRRGVRVHRRSSDRLDQTG